MIKKVIDLEASLSEYKTRETQRESQIQQLKTEINQYIDIAEKRKEELEEVRRAHDSEILQLSEKLDSSADKLQKVQQDELKVRQLQMKIEEITIDLSRAIQESQEKDDRIRELNSKNDSLKEEQTSLSMEYESESKQLKDKLQREIASLKHFETLKLDLEKQVNSFQLRCTEIENENQRLKAELSSSQEREASLKEKSEKLDQLTSERRERTPAQEIVTNQAVRDLESQNKQQQEEILALKTKIAKLEDKLLMTLKQQEAKNEEKRIETNEDLVKTQAVEDRLKGELESSLRENEQLRERLKISEAALSDMRLREGTKSRNSLGGSSSISNIHDDFAPFTLFEDNAHTLDVEGNVRQTPSWRRHLHNISRLCDLSSIRLTRYIKKNSLARVLGLSYFVVLNLILLYYLLTYIF